MPKIGVFMIFFKLSLFIPLALSGRVPVKVTDENGGIKAGDLLTTSSLTGHAMKFSLIEMTGEETMKEFIAANKENERRRNSILGKALEDFTDDKIDPSTDYTGEASAKNWKTGRIMTLVTLQ